ncbi:ArsR/SmtB family transcription factor [Nonomuraea africana]|uniref:DNA-binding transcriptional ArsR family regulator n=1 Tax=Nonomuraea africana TaxID=46171 RepID=A0ABR9K826_9ACTN|nr:helix-turn-helix domain-containing protein [Nonomuraea africana]MBE1557727.1 DNA-binding transcriptional ArsR family regulator [Nonomuraea africana]
MTDETDDRLLALEARVAALEAQIAAPTPRVDGSGLFTYGGQARLGGYEWSWEVARSPEWLMEQPSAQLATVLAAAGHPARFEILKLLVTGPRPIAELQAELGLASPGQLYHHLKTLTAAGLVDQPERGVYRVPPRAVFPVLALAAAAVDVLHQS